MSDTLAATSSANSAAPGFCTTRPATTPAASHVPYKMFCAGETARNAGVAAAQSAFQAQNTTPNATAIAAVTTISTVRQDRDELTRHLHHVFRSPAARRDRTRPKRLQSPRDLRGRARRRRAAPRRHG